jgi:hypothetical protein
MPEAVVNIYDKISIQAVSFRGEEVLTSWGEAINATVPVVLPAGVTNTSFSNAYLAPSSTESFDIIDTASTTSSEFDLIYDSDTDSAMPTLEPVSNSEDEAGFDEPYSEVRRVDQVAVEAFLQAGQPYPGDDHIQEEQHFLVYQMSDTEHIVMDNLLDEDVPLPTHFVCDHEFDVIVWYTVHYHCALGLPEDYNDNDDLFSQMSLTMTMMTAPVVLQSKCLLQMQLGRRVWLWLTRVQWSTASHSMRTSWNMSLCRARALQLKGQSFRSSRLVWCASSSHTRCYIRAHTPGPQLVFYPSAGLDWPLFRTSGNRSNRLPLRTGFYAMKDY